jgi:hypothetical protein
MIGDSSDPLDPSPFIAICGVGRFEAWLLLGTVDLLPPLGYERQLIAYGRRLPGSRENPDSRTAEIRQEFHRVLKTTEAAGASPDAMRHLE